MAAVIGAWKYTSRVIDRRRAKLEAPGSFQEVVRLVKDDMSRIQVRAKPGIDPGLTDCIQPIFTFDLLSTFDIFFNGPWGYRAQYWASAEGGLAANAVLLSALAPKLLGALDPAKAPDLAKIDVCASLGAASAKIWIDEGQFPFSNLTEDLDIDRWVKEARNKVTKARWGLCAPEATTVEVKGALIDPDGNEVVPARKIRRHHEIHNYGFS